MPGRNEKGEREGISRENMGIESSMMDRCIAGWSWIQKNEEGGVSGRGDWEKVTADMETSFDAFPKSSYLAAKI